MKPTRLLYPITVIALLIAPSFLAESESWHCEKFEYLHRARSDTAMVCISETDTLVRDTGYGTAHNEFKRQLIDSTDYETTTRKSRNIFDG